MRESIIPVPADIDTQGRDTLLQRLGRKLFLAKLAGLRHGELTVIDGGERWTFGRRDADCGLHATIEVLHPQTYADAAFGGTIGGGEAFLQGHWRTDDLTTLIRLFIVNREVMESVEGGAAIATAPLRRVLHWLNRNSRDGSRRNIAPH
jgi:cyclopropane-fatty-acyl-phospholipid synthase